MRHGTPLLSLALALALVACGDDDVAPSPDPAATTTEPEPTPEPEPEPEPAAPSTTHIGQEVDREASREARMAADVRERARQVRTQLRAARQATRGGDHAAALPLFERVLELAPSDERLLCETGYVAYRAGDLERASYLVSKALRRFGNPQQVSEAMRVPMAMCLYNGGRVAEERELNDKARGYYRTSLMLRENATVRERYRGVGGEDAEAPAPEPAVETLDALLAQIGEELCQEETLGGDRECRPEVDRREESGSPGFAEVALVSLTTGDYGAEQYVQLAVRGADGWREAGTVLYVYNPGMAGISEEGEVGELEFEELIEGEPPELIFDVSHSRYDVDMGIDEEEYAQSEGTVICGLVDELIRCSMLPREHSYERVVSGLAPEEEAGDIDHGDLPIEERYAAQHDLDPEHGTITMRATEGELPLQARRWQGTHPLRDVLLSEDFRL